MNENELELETLTSSERNKKSKTKFIIGGLLIVIAIGIGLYFGYKKLNNDPVSIYKDSINNVYKSLNSMLKEYKEKSVDLDFYKDPIQYNLDFKLESNIPELANFTNLNYHIGLGLDYSKEQMNFELGIKDKNETIVSALLAYINNTLYLKSDELFSKVLNLDEQEAIFDTSIKINNPDAGISPEELDIILKEMKTILIDSLDKDKFKTEDSKITINDKEYKGKKVSYILDEENLKRTISFIKEQILKNDKLKDALVAVLGIDKSELESTLNEATEINDASDTIIVLYTDNLNNVIAGEFLVENIKLISFNCVNKEFNLIMEAEGQALTISKDKNDLVNVKFNDGATDILDLLIENKKYDNIKIDYRINIEGSTYSGTIEETNIKRTTDNISSNIKLTFNTSVLGNPINLSLTGSSTLSKKNIESIDTTGSIKIDDMTEAEAGEFLQNINKILEKFGLQDLLSSMM